MGYCGTQRIVSAVSSVGLALIFAACFMVRPASAGSIPSGWTCSGTCGSLGADGVVTLSPFGSSQYEYISTSNGTFGVGALPTGALGSETNGSTLATSVFSAKAGEGLNFYFNFVTSDGAGFSDYAWAELFTSGGTPVALLFSARTEPSGSIVPGLGLPSPSATLTPSSVDIIGGAPDWSPLGGSSGTCFASGCGYTGWVDSQYTISTAGNYYLEFGATNWIDEAYQTGMAIDGVTVGGVQVGGSTPEPGTLLLLGTGLAPIGLWFRKRFA